MTDRELAEAIVAEWALIRPMHGVSHAELLMDAITHALCRVRQEERRAVRLKDGIEEYERIKLHGWER